MRARLCKYESEFVAQCKKLKLHIEDDEDFCPIVRAKGKRLKKMLIMCPWMKTHFGIVILTTSGKTKNRFVGKIKDTKADSYVVLNGDTEAVVLVKNADMEKVIKPMKFIRRKNLTDEQRKKIGEWLKKARDAKNA